MQKDLDAEWTSLLARESEPVLHRLSEAFEDNEAPSAAVGVLGTEVSLLVVVPRDTEIPDRKPSVTAAGNLSLKKLTKTETAEVYKQLVCGYALATIREAFAVVPSLTSGRIVVVRPPAARVFGAGQPEVMLAARCTRSSVAGLAMSHCDAVGALDRCCTDVLFVEKGVTRALQPLSLASEPDLQTLVQSVDMSDLIGGS